MNSRLAMSAVLALAATPLAVPAQAPQAPQAQPAQPIQPELKLSKKERTALTAVQTALAARDFAAASAALGAAQAAVEGADGRYAVASLQFDIGRATNNLPQSIAGLEAMIASGKVPPAALPNIYKTIAAAAEQTNDRTKADQALARYLELAPNDPDAYISAAQARIGQKRVPEALTLLDRAIAMRKAAGQPVPEQWYKVGVNQAYGAKLVPQSVKFGHDWIASYPNPKNWRDALAILRELSAPDKETDLDIYRLQRAAKALAGERDYAEYARALSSGGYPGEAKAVIDEGVSSRMIDAAKAPFSDMRKSYTTRAAADRPTLPAEEKKAAAAATGGPALAVANAYFGYGDYAKAAALYRTALQKGSVDANLVNTRLGLALALGGQKAEAEAAIKSVAGARSQLANYILIWLAQRV